MTTNLPSLAVNSAIPTPHEMQVFCTMADTAVASKMYRNIGDQSGVMMIMLAAREMGLPPMACLNGGLNIINGKVEISARMMSAMIRRAGHSLKVLESTDTNCVLKGKRSDNGDTLMVTFSIADAQKAGLIKSGGGWTKWPKDMLFARALSRLARQLFSDVIGMGYVEGEIKPSKCEIIPMEENEIDDDNVKPLYNEDEYTVDQLQDLVEGDDKLHILRYLEEIKARMNWTQSHTIGEMLKNTVHMLERFEEWKNRNQ